MAGRVRDTDHYPRPVVDLADAVAGGDLDELIRLVDGLCEAREWDRIVELRDRCRHALEQRGLQLWPAAEYAEFRLARDAPGPFAGPVVETEAGRFALGPLWEVAASTHTWEELAEHVPTGPARALCAHERVLRGEDLESDDTIDRSVLEIPLRLESWEPEYPTATYGSDEADFGGPALHRLRLTDLPAPGAEIGDDESLEALLDIGSVWARQSNGSAVAVAVEGDALAAIAALEHPRARVCRVDGAAALESLGWAAASGGAYGRRRGSPIGRFSAWWAVATLADIEWPAAPDAIGSAVERLEWVVWEPEGQPPGWSGSVAVSDPQSGLSWALEAHDAYREEEESF